MLNSIQEAIQDIQEGKVVIVVDDEDRENEGDFVCSSQKVTPRIINFMATHGRGLICCSIDKNIANKLDLKPVQSNFDNSLYDTPFTISVDLIGDGVTTGISAGDRSKTIQKMIAEDSQPQDFARPGHIFPLLAKENGVLERPGHTEASVDLAILAGHKPSGVIVEICNPDGSMARLNDLKKIAKKWDLKIISIKDLIDFRKQKKSNHSSENFTKNNLQKANNQEFTKDLNFSSTINLPTKFGDFKMQVLKDFESNLEHSIIWKGNPKEKNFKLRVHSSCQTGDVFGSERCDCGQQLEESLKLIQKAESGMIIYLQQEGRGIGLFSKIEAYKLQENGRDTVEANLDLGYKEDQRDYKIIKQISNYYKFSEIDLITNNPLKIDSLKKLGIKINQRIPLKISPNKNNKKYLETKKNKMNHLF